MKLDLLETTPSTAEEVAACSKLLDQCMREVRTIFVSSVSPMLDEIGLKSAIPWYLKGFSSRSGIETTFNMSEDFARLVETQNWFFSGCFKNLSPMCSDTPKAKLGSRIVGFRQFGES